MLLVTPAAAQSRRIAVLDFANTTHDPALEWLGAAVAETITTKLHAIKSLQLVEHGQLYKVPGEQKLNLSDLVDPSQAVKMGKLLGAEQVVLGGYSAFGAPCDSPRVSSTRRPAPSSPPARWMARSI